MVVLILLLCPQVTASKKNGTDLDESRYYVPELNRLQPLWIWFGLIRSKGHFTRTGINLFHMYFDFTRTGVNLFHMYFGFLYRFCLNVIFLISSKQLEVFNYVPCEKVLWSWKYSIWRFIPGYTLSGTRIRISCLCNAVCPSVFMYIGLGIAWAVWRILFIFGIQKFILSASEHPSDGPRNTK
jgi:hypothetical protein